MSLTPEGKWAKGNKEKLGELVAQINQKKPDLLFVGYTMDKQLKFIPENLSKLKVKLAMGVGGSFDYLSGEVPRTPRQIRKLGLEWLYRLLQQPWRFRRQLNLFRFGWLVLKEKSSGR